MRIQDFHPQRLPSSPGVYLMKNAHGEILYIGKAKNVRKRVASYFKRNTEVRISFLMQKVSHIDTIIVSNETEALLLENNLIKKYRPKYNVLLKDDQSFFCLAISLSHPWPRIEPIRTKSVTSSSKQMVFGPYVSSEACRSLLETIGLWFPLRTCSDHEFTIRKRPCVLYEMKRCLAPCVNKCTQEEYHAVLNQAILFLKGNVSRILHDLKQAIQKASKEQKFEQAAIYYRSLQRIEHAMTHQNVEKFHTQNMDAIGIYRQDLHAVITVLSIRSGKLLGARHFLFQENVQDDADLLSSFILQYYHRQPPNLHTLLLPIPLHIPNLPDLLNTERAPLLKTPKTGYGKKIVEMAYNNAKIYASNLTQPLSLPYDEMKTLLHLTHYPLRIECYDNAHLQGSCSTGAYVVYEDEAFSPKEYRAFSLPSSKNDLFLLHELLSQRFHALSSKLPDMILVDGGHAQYTQAKKTLREYNLTGIQVLALSKDKGNHSKSLRQEKIFCDTFPKGISLSPTSPLLQFFQKIRDEAHRFVLHKHQKKHRQSLLDTQMTIPGIGKIKKTRLLKKFKSWKGVMRATQEELQAIPGLNKNDIQQILVKQSEYKQ